MKFDLDPQFVRTSAFFSTPIKEIKANLENFVGEDIVVVVDGIGFFNIDKFHRATEEFLEQQKTEAKEAPCPCKPIEYLDIILNSIRSELSKLEYFSKHPHISEAVFDRKAGQVRLDRSKVICRILFDHLLAASDLVFSLRGINDATNAADRSDEKAGE